MPLSPDYTFNLDFFVGTVLAGSCIVGIVVVALDDLTGVGVADNALAVPLGVGIAKGLVIIFP